MKNRFKKDKPDRGEDYILAGLMPVWITSGKRSIHIIPDRDGGVSVKVYKFHKEMENPLGEIIS